MPVIPLQQIRPELATKVPRLAREYVRIFDEARHRRGNQRWESVRAKVLSLHEEGRLSITAILNEEEPFRTFALEVLNHWKGGVQQAGAGPFQTHTIRVGHVGGMNLTVCVDRRVVRDLGFVQHYGRQHAPMKRGDELDLPVETAVGFLEKHGWFVKRHLPLRVRERYRPIVELRDGLPLGADGETTDEGVPNLDPKYLSKAAADVEAAGRKLIKASFDQATKASVRDEVAAEQATEADAGEAAE